MTNRHRATQDESQRGFENDRIGTQLANLTSTYFLNFIKLFC